MKKKLYENRELSWLKFNERVLKEAKNPEVPLGERLGFVSIYQSNLDEFFMVRVGCLHDQINLFDDYKDDKSNMTSHQQIEAICKEVRNLNKKKEKIYSKLVDTLGEYKVKIADFSEITGREEKIYSDLFKKMVQPFLSPIVVGKQQVFPFLKNKDVYAISVLKSKSSKIKIGVVACRGEDFPKVFEVPGKEGTFVLTEDLILHYMSSLFPNHVVMESSLIRITRSADIGMERFYDEDLDYRAEMENIIKMRRKLCPVRIEMTKKLDKETMEKICQFLVLERGRVFFNNTPLDFGFFSDIKNYLKRYPELFYKPRIPAVSKADVIDRVLKNEDVLLAYPFESMQPFLDMLKKASENKNTESIKITLYRVAKQSAVVQHLINAAKNGIKVDVLVELKARFDEENNIEWSKQLEKAGCNVIYGWSGLKVHSKLCLITFKDGENKSYITQIGTGNYNENTAKLYTDLALITADTRIAEEAQKVFEALFSDKLINSTEHLLVAPNCMKDKILDLIDEEIQHAKAGEKAYIGAKMNSLTDVRIINKLVKASEAGVKIDLIIRGICCLQPDINGYTDNINIISIVGQYLEHSRIYMFGTPERRKMFISSADWMTRNMSRRVEVAAPIYSESVRRRIQVMFDIMLADTAKARKKHPDGTYKRVHRNYSLNSQEYFADNKGLSTEGTLKAAEELLQKINTTETTETE
ncbi:MAG: polyphosphate kinase 1 [Oscillospiraceae bacterium]|nr:polyphosphate kinase 1 [Oscillospiraceae bacterium]MDD6086163.1 polyphosphate kinase 1 [Oscillospiraceae bacterium]MDY3257023.1 polyphosphate kinase 1 [Ruminococcus callidus]